MKKTSTRKGIDADYHQYHLIDTNDHNTPAVARAEPTQSVLGLTNSYQTPTLPSSRATMQKSNKRKHESEQQEVAKRQGDVTLEENSSTDINQCINNNTRAKIPEYENNSTDQEIRIEHTTISKAHFIPSLHSSSQRIWIRI